jgi:hypothetical protein
MSLEAKKSDCGGNQMRVLPDFFYTPIVAYLVGLLLGYLLWG